jgi:hypothetical protein
MLSKIFTWFWAVFLLGWVVGLLGFAYLRAPTDLAEALGAGLGALACLGYVVHLVRSHDDPRALSDRIERMAHEALARVERVRASGTLAAVTLREARFIDHEEDGFRYDLTWAVSAAGRPDYDTTRAYWAGSNERAALRAGLRLQARVDPQDPHYLLIDWGDGVPR